MKTTKPIKLEDLSKAINDIERWKGHAYQESDEVGLAIEVFKDYVKDKSKKQVGKDSFADIWEELSDILLNEIKISHEVYGDSTVLYEIVSNLPYEVFYNSLSDEGQTLVKQCIKERYSSVLNKNLMWGVRKLDDGMGGFEYEVYRGDYCASAYADHEDAVDMANELNNNIINL